MPNPKCSVLCVDDHHDTSEMLQMLLSEENYEVHTAATIEEACQMASETQYDLYVLDKRLPDGTGVELCETLAKITPSVPTKFTGAKPSQPAPPPSSPSPTSKALSTPSTNSSPAASAPPRLRNKPISNQIIVRYR